MSHKMLVSALWTITNIMAWSLQVYYRCGYVMVQFSNSWLIHIWLENWLCKMLHFFLVAYYSLPAIVNGYRYMQM